MKMWACGVDEYEANRRKNLAARRTHLRKFCVEKTLKVVVFGSQKIGKQSFCNQLLEYFLNNTGDRYALKMAYPCELEFVVLHGDSAMKASVPAHFVRTPNEMPVWTLWRQVEFQPELEKCDAVLFMFSLCSAKSFFDVLNKWYPLYQSLIKDSNDEEKDKAQLYVVGNKSDVVHKHIYLQDQQNRAYTLLLIRRFRAQGRHPASLFC